MRGNLRQIKQLSPWMTQYQSINSHAASSASKRVESLSTADGPSLGDFITKSKFGSSKLSDALPSSSASNNKRVFIETHGCQMNVNDSEVVLTVLSQAGFTSALSPEDANIILLNTCAIRENAESKIWQRLGYFKNLKIQTKSKLKQQYTTQDSSTTTLPVIGVLGCMAERLKHRLLESDKLVDLVAGPDAYRDLPRLIDIVQGNRNTGGNRSYDDHTGTASSPKTNTSTSTNTSTTLPIINSAINVQLSLDETYADVIPIRPAGTHSVFLSIMRGCNNMCSFCVVPFTRGRERSRPLESIIDEVKMLSDQGVKEITLLGQNVNSYSYFDPTKNSHPHTIKTPPTSSMHTNTIDHTNNDTSPTTPFDIHYAKGFKSIYKPQRSGALTFSDLLWRIAEIDPEMRVRFTSPHPKDFSNDVLDVIAQYHNICKQLHMPAQSGSTTVLERMKRGYTREAYDELLLNVRDRIPDVSLSTDMIAGFCGETDEEHAASVDLLQKTKYDLAFLFAYSEREKTHAARHLVDDVAHAVKIERLQELIATYRSELCKKGEKEVGKCHLVLVEGPSRRSETVLTGRTDTFKRVVFDDIGVCPSLVGLESDSSRVNLGIGDYAAVKIVDGGGGGSMKGVALARTSIKEFVDVYGSAVPSITLI